MGFVELEVFPSSTYTYAVIVYLDEFKYSLFSTAWDISGIRITRLRLNRHQEHLGELDDRSRMGGVGRMETPEMLTLKETATEQLGLFYTMLCQ